jgi:hypothetical protein
MQNRDFNELWVPHISHSEMWEKLLLLTDSRKHFRRTEA